MGNVACKKEKTCWNKEPIVYEYSCPENMYCDMSETSRNWTFVGCKNIEYACRFNPSTPAPTGLWLPKIKLPIISMPTPTTSSPVPQEDSTELPLMIISAITMLVFVCIFLYYLSKMIASACKKPEPARVTDENALPEDDDIKLEDI